MSELERIIHDDSNGLDYILVGEIYLPLITVPEEWVRQANNVRSRVDEIILNELVYV